MGGPGGGWRGVGGAVWGSHMGSGGASGVWCGVVYQVYQQVYHIVSHQPPDLPYQDTPHDDGGAPLYKLTIVPPVWSRRLFNKRIRDSYRVLWCISLMWSGTVHRNMMHVGKNAGLSRGLQFLSMHHQTLANRL